jgi:hypothetical protein
MHNPPVSTIDNFEWGGRALIVRSISGWLSPEYDAAKMPIKRMGILQAITAQTSSSYQNSRNTSQLKLICLYISTCNQRFCNDCYPSFDTPYLTNLDGLKKSFRIYNHNISDSIIHQITG